MLNLKKFRSRDLGLSDLLPYAFIVDDGIIVNKDGSLSIALQYYGHDLISSEQEVLDDLTLKINQNFIKFGNGWCFHIDVVRTIANNYPDTPKEDFQNPTAYLINKERMAAYQINQYFENTYIITCTYLPSYEAVNLLQLLIHSKPDNYSESFIEHLKQFKWHIDTLINNLSIYLHLKQLSSAMFIKHIHYCITGQTSNISLPQDCLMYLDVLLATVDIQNTKDGIMIGGKYVKILTINGFPDYARNDILAALTKRGFEYRWNTRFIPLDEMDANKHLNKIRKFWRNMTIGIKNALSNNKSQNWQDDSALTMKHDVEEAMNANASHNVKFGFYSASIIIFDDSQESLMQKTKDIITTLDHYGFAVRIETFHSVENYLAALPANAVSNVDNVLMHTINFAHLMPSTASWLGNFYHPSPQYPNNSPALIYCNTDGNTPFRLNLHVNDVGHFLIFGPTGSGKSTLLNLLVASQLKYQNAKVFVFDRKLSMSILCYTMGGLHYNLISDDHQLEQTSIPNASNTQNTLGAKNASNHLSYNISHNISLCPLAYLENEQDVMWANEYIILLFSLQNLSLNSNQQQEIYDAINIMVVRNKNDRSLEQLKSNVQDSFIKDGLTRYIRAGNLLNSKTDSLALSSFTVFEMQELMNLGDNSVLIPATLLCLFKRLEREFKTSAPSLLILDECWSFLSNELFKNKIAIWLKELRAFNVAVGFATQNLSDIDESSIGNVIKENCLTKIYLANPNANNTTTKYYYERFGLSDKQISLIANATMQRDYYYTSPNGCRMFELSLKQVQLQLLAHTSIQDIIEAKQIYLKNPQNFTYNWLMRDGLDEKIHDNLTIWANYYLELIKSNTNLHN